MGRETGTRHFWRCSTGTSTRRDKTQHATGRLVTSVRLDLEPSRCCGHVQMANDGPFALAKQSRDLEGR